MLKVTDIEWAAGRLGKALVTTSDGLRWIDDVEIKLTSTGTIEIKAHPEQAPLISRSRPRLLVDLGKALAMQARC